MLIAIAVGVGVVLLIALARWSDARRARNAVARLMETAEERGAAVTVRLGDGEVRALVVLSAKVRARELARVVAKLRALPPRSWDRTGDLFASAIEEGVARYREGGGGEDAALLDQVRAACAEAGLEPVAVRVAGRMPMDQVAHNLDAYTVVRVRRKSSSMETECNALDFSLDGISGYGFFAATCAEAVGAVVERQSSTRLVGELAHWNLSVIFGGSRTVHHRTLAKMRLGEKAAHE